MARRKSPASKLTAKQRLEEKRALMREQVRKDGLPVENVDQMAQLAKSMEDDWDAKSLDGRARRLQLTLTRLSVADMYLSGYAVDEIATQLNYSVPYVEAQIKNVQTAINQRMLSLSENLVLVQLSRSEQLMKRYYPLALGMDDRAFDRVMKLMALQLELQKSVIIPESEDQMNRLEKMQRTISSQSLLYEVAQDNMDTGWLEKSNMTVDDLFDQVQKIGDLDAIQDKLSKLEGIADKELNPDESGNQPAEADYDSRFEFQTEGDITPQDSLNSDDGGEVVDRTGET